MHQDGFSLVELLVVIAIVGILASISIMSYHTYRERAIVTETVADLKAFESAFNAYLADHDDFPPDSHIVLPPGMSGLIPDDLWGETPLGGTYNWEGPDFYPYAGIAFLDPTASLDKFVLLDRMLDDGLIGQGKFRVSEVNGRYTYIISE